MDYHYKNFGIGFLGCLVSVLAGCGGSTKDSSENTALDSSIVSEKHVLKEAFTTERDENDNVDSPTIWHGANGENWLLATAKEGNTIIVYDAATGKFIQRFGEGGSGAGSFARPNGIAVIDDILLVIERDNHRVQTFSLPGFEPLGIIGQTELKRPYGVAIDKVEETYHLYVTDGYETADEQIPPTNELDERVHYFTFTREAAKIVANHQKSFGDTLGDGILYKVESIAIDREHNRLLVADEFEAQRNIKIYDVAGEFTGELIPNTYFASEPEGISLYTCDAGAGYWITTDQGKVDNKFEVFDRKTLAHLGTFGGEITLNTDGVALTQKRFGKFNKGVFYPVHDDGSVTAIDWADISKALNLELDCTK